MRMFIKRNFPLAIALTIGLIPRLAGAENSIILQSTTSTANSGLYEYLLPKFKRMSGISVHVVAVGTGQAIRNARNCDADVLLVHAKNTEEEFVASGYGLKRYDLMYNDFVIVGPSQDPAAIKGGRSAIAALRQISKQTAKFSSRGDNSGTHKKEMSLWKMADIDPTPFSGKWYLETGSGMGATLNVAVGMGAYTMTDRATWISYKNKQDYTIKVEGDDQLFNQYGVIQVNPAKCADVNDNASQAFINWLLSDDGQRAIASYRLDDRQLFFPNAR